MQLFICDLCGMAELVVKIAEKKDVYVKNDYITKVNIIARSKWKRR